jgi:hypothetical protein
MFEFSSVGFHDADMRQIKSLLCARILSECLIAGFFAAGFSGCATPLKYEAPQSLPDKHEFVRNYRLGESITVNVGEPMVKVRDFWIESAESSVAVPERDVNLKGGLVNIDLVGGRKYQVKGRAYIDGKELTAVAFDEHPTEFRAVLINADGTLHNRIAGSSLRAGAFGSLNRGDELIPLAYTLTISDPSVRLLREKVETIKIAKGYENYELLYTGVSGAGLNLTYREFSPDGLARVAFFQNLTYEAGAKSITFKKFRIAVEKATSESITFTVLSDGYDVRKE